MHTHTHLTALCPGLPGWAGTRKVKPVWISLMQETVSGSGISWAACKSAPRSRQITTPASHHTDFLQAGCNSCRPTNSTKALRQQIVAPSNCNSRSLSTYILLVNRGTKSQRLTSLWLSSRSRSRASLFLVLSNALQSFSADLCTTTSNSDNWIRRNRHKSN